jgi:hypothetical protein
MLTTYKNNGYRILSKYDDTQMNDFVEQLPEQVPEKQVTYECSNGQCNNSNKQYNPDDKIYNSINECKSFCYQDNHSDLCQDIHKSNGYRKLCKYDSQTNTCSEPVQSRPTYECLNGQCQSSNKQYDPSNNVYNSVYECRAFCHPAIPNEDSSFENVSKSNGYRKLCKYDSQTNTCNRLHPDGVTYECLNGQCNMSTKEYDPYNSVYDNINECRRYCQSSIPDEVSYTCIQSGIENSNNLCTQINEYPDINNMPPDGITSFVTADECTSVCGNENESENESDNENENENENDPVYYKNRICMSKIPLTYNFSLKPSLACDTGEFY